MTLTLNTRSGVLHILPRCAGRDEMWLYRFSLGVEWFEELVGFLYLPYRRLCRKCIGP